MARPRSAVSRYKHRKNIDHLKVREAVLYARVSTPEQEREGYSIPAQIKLLEDYATLNGIAIVSSHVDVETARKSGRTAFGNMLRYLRRHPAVRIILVEKTDRLYRNLKDWATIDDLGVEVHFVKENVVMSDGCRSSEKFVHGIKVLMAKAYIDNLSEETRKGMIEKAQQGHWPSCAPIGYCNVRDGQGRNVIAVDPEAGPIVTRLFDWYATGLYSLKEVTVMARNAGVHEPLVSTDIWDAVQKTLDERSSANIRAKPHFFPFTGLIKCGYCGCALVAQIQKGKYIYYRCSGFRGRCPERFVRQEALEAHFLVLLRKLRCGRDQFQDIRNAVKPGCLENNEAGTNVASLHHPSAMAGMPGALLDAGLALLDMGRSLHLRLPGLPDEMRQMLGLVFHRCSWANGELTGVFNPPFDIFAGHLATGEGTASIGPLLSDLFLRAMPDVRLLIARYNAMERVRMAGADDNLTGSEPREGCHSLSETLRLAA